MSLNLPAGVQITAPLQPGFDAILTHDALALVAKLHRAFETRRQELLKAALSARPALMPAKCPTSCRKPSTSAKATGKLHRCRRPLSVVALKLPARLKQK